MKNFSLTIPGLTIACKSWGNPGNPPILALHGWLDNADSFEPLAQYLRDTFYVVAIDLPGHGHSSHLPSCSFYHFTDSIFYVLQIMDALGLDKVHLLGHSMGACLSSLVAGVAPDRFLSISLIEGLGPFSSPPETACKQLGDYLTYLNETAIKPSKGYAKIASAALARAQRGYVTLDMARKLVERALIERDGKYYWRHDRRLLVPSPLRMTETQILSCLAAIKAQTCLILADGGFSFDTDVMKERIKAVTPMEIERLPGGHHIHMEKPEEIALLLIKFLAKHQR